MRTGARVLLPSAPFPLYCFYSRVQEIEECIRPGYLLNILVADRMAGAVMALDSIHKIARFRQSIFDTLPTGAC